MGLPMHLNIRNIRAVGCRVKFGLETFLRKYDQGFGKLNLYEHSYDATAGYMNCEWNCRSMVDPWIYLIVFR